MGYTDDSTLPYDESHWNDGAHNPYIRGKTEGERLAWMLADELEVVTVQGAELAKRYPAYSDSQCPGGNLRR